MDNIIIQICRQIACRDGLLTFLALPKFGQLDPSCLRQLPECGVRTVAGLVDGVSGILGVTRARAAPIDATLSVRSSGKEVHGSGFIARSFRDISEKPVHRGPMHCAGATGEAYHGDGRTRWDGGGISTVE
jgi:hypothetical protein